MGTYNLPRNVKGEGRILYIFSTKAFLWTAGGALIGAIFYLIFSAIGLGVVGIVILAIFALIGFIIANFKIPDTAAFSITKKTGGENIDDVIKRGIKFKLKKNRIYIYDRNTEIVNKKEGGTKDE